MSVFDFNNLEDRYVKKVLNSGLFDSEWYVKRYPDVLLSGMDPLTHFLKYGTILERDPGPNFVSSFYSDVNTSIRRRGINPLVHYVSRAKGTLPRPDNVLWAANNLAAKRGYPLAIRLAKENLPDTLQHTVCLMQANDCLKKGDQKGWLESLNKYLNYFKIGPVYLDSCDKSTLLSRFKVELTEKSTSGPLVTVIMPAWNSEGTVYYAAKSILNQTWINLELIIVDDCSTDGTWNVLQKIVSEDNRVKIYRNKVNVGPYVSKNIALSHATGNYITGHDADDWAFPQRIERHFELIQKNGRPRASLTYMLRIAPDGEFSKIGKIRNFSFDGVARKASISCLFDANFLREELGHWDSVRFGADSEMIARAENILGDEFKIFKDISMICLDLETSLTNHPEHGVHANDGKLSDSRKSYLDAWVAWHDNGFSNQGSRLEFPLKSRAFFASKEMQVSYEDALMNLK